MRSHGERVDGTQMGFPGDVETDVCFVYDGRGPRISPAIEVQQWIEPPLVGHPYERPEEIGFHALGVTVADREATVDALVVLGSGVTETTPGSAVCEGEATTLRDPNGIDLDVVEQPHLEATRLAHLRATCADLERSIDWYTTLGFAVAAQEHGATSSSARLQLPDEPFALVLTQWHDSPSTGVPYESGNHRGLYRFAIAVDDTRAAYDALAERWSLSSPPRLVTLGGTPVPDMWIAFLADPDGLVVELVERPRSAFR